MNLSQIEFVQTFLHLTVWKPFQGSVETETLQLIIVCICTYNNFCNKSPPPPPLIIDLPHQMSVTKGQNLKRILLKFKKPK